MNAYMTVNDDPFFSKFCSWTVGHEQLFRDMLKMKNQVGGYLYNAYPPHKIVTGKRRDHRSPSYMHSYHFSL